MTTLLEEVKAKRALLTERIKERARALGFEKVGVVRAEPLEAERVRLEEWLRRGYHGEMGWMARDAERRAAPAQLLAGARSVVVVAFNYYTPHEHTGAHATGKVSRYAWGDDYHDVLGERLRALLEWIKSERPEAQGKVCVDAQPTMDKAWAVRAGLGWIGKHSNLITREYGSWVFLGELLLDIELSYDERPSEDHCGTCTLCLEACPTGAIVEPYVVDSRRCISYATIELRAAELPREVAENLDGWLYGCDVCQDVCPWNRFEPREGNVDADLSQMLELSPETFATRFRRSPIKRAKLSGLQRNAATLLDPPARREED